jgi:hypothetical protein
MTERADNAREFAREVAESMANRGGSTDFGWLSLLAAAGGLSVSYGLAFAAAYAFPRIMENRVPTEEERRRRFERMRPFLWPAMLVLFGLALWFAIWFGGFLARAV